MAAPIEKAPAVSEDSVPIPSSTSKESSTIPADKPMWQSPRFLIMVVIIIILIIVCVNMMGCKKVGADMEMDLFELTESPVIEKSM